MGKDETPVANHEEMDQWWGNSQQEELENRPFTKEDKKKFETCNFVSDKAILNKLYNLIEIGFVKLLSKFQFKTSNTKKLTS